MSPNLTTRLARFKWLAVVILLIGVLLYLFRDNLSTTFFPTPTPQVMQMPSLVPGAVPAVQLDEQGQIWKVAYSPDGKYVALGLMIQGAKLYDAHTGQYLRTFPGRQAKDNTLNMESLRFSPDSKYLLATDNVERWWDPGRAILWDVNTGQIVQTYDGHKEMLRQVAFSPDGKSIATASADKTVDLWAIQTGTLLNTFSGYNDQVMSVTFSPDGKYLLAGSLDGAAWLWDINSGYVVRRFNGSRRVLNVAISPDERYVAMSLVSLTADNKQSGTGLWDFATGQLLKYFPSVGDQSLEFSPDGKLLLIADQSAANLWDYSAGKLIESVRGSNGAFSSDNRFVVAGNVVWPITR